MDRCEGEYLYAKRRQIFHGLRWETGIRIRITCFKRVLTFLLASLVLFTIAQWFCYAPPDMTPREAHMWMTISRRRGRKLLSVERDEKGRIIAEDKVDFWNLRTSIMEPSSIMELLCSHCLQKIDPIYYSQHNKKPRRRSIEKPAAAKKSRRQRMGNKKVLL